MMVLPALIPDPRQKTDTSKVIHVLEVSKVNALLFNFQECYSSKVASTCAGPNSESPTLN